MKFQVCIYCRLWDIRRNVSPKLIELSQNTLCWCTSEGPTFLPFIFVLRNLLWSWILKRLKKTFCFDAFLVHLCNVFLFLLCSVLPRIILTLRKKTLQIWTVHRRKVQMWQAACWFYWNFDDQFNLLLLFVESRDGEASKNHRSKYSSIIITKGQPCWSGRRFEGHYKFLQVNTLCSLFK